MDKDLDLLKEALSKYKEKWTHQRMKLNLSDDTMHIHIQYTTMMGLAQWIINSINGGLDKPHGTNICNIIHTKDTKEDITYD